MKYICLKTGLEPLDSMHGIGLGLTLSVTSGQPAAIEDCGLFYKVTTTETIQLIDLPDLLAHLLPLTTSAALERDANCTERGNYVFDGALTWLFTSPGVRAISVAAVRRKSFYNPNIVGAAISKWSQARARLLTAAQQMSKPLGTSAERILASYSADMPQPISFGPRPSKGVIVPLTLEPTLASAYRHPFADGHIADRTNVSALSPPLASILILLGSIYALRGQEVAGKLVHIYAPIIRKTIICGNPVLPCLPATDASSDEALMGVWLQAQLGHLLPDSGWAGLTYQILQTQGVQQSFSLERGTLSVSDTLSLSSTRGQLLQRWTGWLCRSRSQRPPNIDDLIRGILHDERGALSSHIYTAAHAATRKRKPQWLMYTEDEVCEAIVMTNSKDLTSTGLLEIIGQPHGTYRFGTALRALGRHLPAAQRELVNDIETAYDLDSLLRILARVVEQCAVSAARNPFAIVPDDDDLRELLAEVERFGVKIIARMIFILAPLRYPRLVDKSPEATASNQDTSEAV